MLYSCLTPPLAINTRKPEGRPCNAFVRAKLSIQYIYTIYNNCCLSGQDISERTALKPVALFVSGTIRRYNTRELRTTEDELNGGVLNA